MSASSYATRADANRANSQFSTGPITEAGKATVSANAVRHGLTANLQRLDPRDSPAYQQNLIDLTNGLAPANSAEEFLIRDLAMLKSRLERLEAAEYAVLMSAVDGSPDEATVYLSTAPSLSSLEKTERFLRRNYMQTWSRLERLQRDRKNRERELAENQPDQPALSNLPKQSQSGSTHSKQEPTTNSTAPTPAPPITSLGVPVLAPSLANHPIGEINATAA